MAPDDRMPSAPPIDAAVVEEIARLKAVARAALDGAEPTQQRLAPVKAQLARLAALTAAWSAQRFPDPPAQQAQERYLIDEEPDQTLGLYLMVMRRGKRTPIHDHRTWACIAAVQGSETNLLYTRTDDGARPDQARVRAIGTHIVAPGNPLAILPHDIHEVRIEDDETIRHLHLYGRSLETLHDRRVYKPASGTSAPMLIQSPTLRRLPDSECWSAMGDRLVGGDRWGYFDSRTPGPVLLMLPGAQGSIRAFDHLLATLCRHFRVIVLGYPALDDAAAMARSAIGLLKAWGIERVTLVGTSLGGYVGQWMAAHAPDMVRRIVLVNAFVDPAPASDPAELASTRAMSDADFKAQALDRLRRQPPGLFRDYMLSMVDAQGGDSLRLRRIAVLGGAPVPALSLAPQQVTLMDAQDDMVVSATMRDALAQRYPAARRISVASGGHSLHYTRADELAGLLCEPDLREAA